MKLDPQLKEILDSLDPAAEKPVEEMTPDEARATWKAEMAEVAGKPCQVASVSEHEVPGPGGPLKVRIYEPDGLDGEPAPMLIYIHGGGYIRGDLDTHDDVCRYLCHHTPCIVASVDYRLAPENKFPDQVEDCFAAASWLANNAGELGADPARIAIGGDSAGGNFTCAATMLARDKGGPSFCFQLLIYPVTDLASENESKRLYSSGYLLNSMPFYIQSYVRNDDDLTNPLASPLRATNHANLPPAFVLTAGFDPLRDEGQAYAAKLRDAGVVVEHKCYESMIHGFVSITGLIASAEVGLADSAAALRAAFTS